MGTVRVWFYPGLVIQRSSKQAVGMKIVLLSFVLALTQARPQEFASPDEVELIDPVRDDSGVVENGGGPIVVVVRGGVPNLPRLPGIGNFFNSVPGFSDFPFQSSVPRIPSIFGGLDGDSEDSDGEPVCGPLCQMFRVLQGIQGEIDDIHTQTATETSSSSTPPSSTTSVRTAS